MLLAVARVPAFLRGTWRCYTGELTSAVSCGCDPFVRRAYAHSCLRALRPAPAQGNGFPWTLAGWLPPDLANRVVALRTDLGISPLAEAVRRERGRALGGMRYTIGLGTACTSTRGWDSTACAVLWRLVNRRFAVFARSHALRRNAQTIRSTSPKIDSRAPMRYSIGHDINPPHAIRLAALYPRRPTC